MRVKFLLGPAGSGKTFRCLEEVRAALANNPDGDPLVFLAPKQATFQIERQLLDAVWWGERPREPKQNSINGFTRLNIFSFDRLAQFVREHPVSHILGAHIEMTTTPGKDYGHEAPTHPDEHLLELPPEAAYELQRVTDGTDFAKPAVTDDFIVFPVEARPPDPAGAELPLAKAAP